MCFPHAGPICEGTGRADRAEAADLAALHCPLPPTHCVLCRSPHQPAWLLLALHGQGDGGSAFQLADLRG